MKPKYIVGFVVAALVVVGTVIALNDNKVDYLNFAAAQASGRNAQIAGTWVKEKGADYDAENNVFRFTMRDRSGTAMPVVYEGAKPNNFEISTELVVTGRLEGGEMRASNILTKCPSKYESNGSELSMQKGSGNVQPRQNP